MVSPRAAERGLLSTASGRGGGDPAGPYPAHGAHRSAECGGGRPPGRGFYPVPYRSALDNPRGTPRLGRAAVWDDRHGVARGANRDGGRAAPARFGPRAHPHWGHPPGPREDAAFPRMDYLAHPRPLRLRRGAADTIEAREVRRVGNVWSVRWSNAKCVP